MGHQKRGCKTYLDITNRKRPPRRDEMQGGLSVANVSNEEDFACKTERGIFEWRIKLRVISAGRWVGSV